jgi:hypothetical protein
MIARRLNGDYDRSSIEWRLAERQLQVKSYSSNNSIDERSDLVIDERSDLVIDERSDLVIDERSDLVIDERSDLVIDERSDLVIDERSDLVIFPNSVIALTWISASIDNNPESININYKKMLKQILSLYINVADPAIYILSGLLSIEAEIHVKAITLFGNITRSDRSSITRSDRSSNK